MTEYSQMHIIANNEELSFDEITRMSIKRAVHVLQDFTDMQLPLWLNDQPLDPEKVHLLSNADLLKACRESKEHLGQKGIKEAYADKLAQSRQMWKDITAKSDGQTFKESHVIVKVAGIDPQIIAKMITSDSDSTLNIDLAYQLHPEHFIFGLTGNTQTVMETIGAYKEPTLFQLQEVPAEQGPQKDPKAIAAPKAQLVLDDGSRLPMYAMHEFYQTADGMEIHLGLYFPSATPAEAVIGHKEHFAIEFANSLAMALDKLNH